MSVDERFADTPDWKWRATITTEDGQEHDITRELAVMYDAIVGSMDWGSGFLDIEDVAAMLRIGGLCGFEGGYSRESGTPVLLDRNGEPMNAFVERYGRVTPADGWGELSYSTRGNVVKAERVTPNRDGEVVAIGLVNVVDGRVQGTYPLPEPVTVRAGHTVTLEAPVDDATRGEASTST